jgi:serine/threonine protein kinase
MAIKCPKCHFDNPDETVYCGKCATPFPSSKEIPVTETLELPAEGLTTGSTFAGRYQIIKELGKGGMDQVSSSKDINLNRVFALEFLSCEPTRNREAKERVTQLRNF